MAVLAVLVWTLLSHLNPVSSLTSSHLGSLQGSPSRAEFSGYDRQIKPLACVSKDGSQRGTCMFAWNCVAKGGKHLGTCIDSFYFGSCCQVSEPEQVVNNLVDVGQDSSQVYLPYSPSTTALPSSSSVSLDNASTAPAEISPSGGSSTESVISEISSLAPAEIPLPDSSSTVPDVSSTTSAENQLPDSSSIDSVMSSTVPEISSTTPAENPLSDSSSTDSVMSSTVPEVSSTTPAENPLPDSSSTDSVNSSPFTDDTSIEATAASATTTSVPPTDSTTTLSTASTSTITTTSTSPPPTTTASSTITTTPTTTPATITTGPASTSGDFTLDPTEDQTTEVDEFADMTMAVIVDDDFEFYETTNSPTIPPVADPAASPVDATAGDEVASDDSLPEINLDQATEINTSSDAAIEVNVVTELAEESGATENTSPTMAVTELINSSEEEEKEDSSEESSEDSSEEELFGGENSTVSVSEEDTTAAMETGTTGLGTPPPSVQVSSGDIVVDEGGNTESSTDLINDESTTEEPTTKMPVEMALKEMNYLDICGTQPSFNQTFRDAYLFKEESEEHGQRARQGKVVNGERSEWGRWPWQISLRQWRGASNTFLHKCGAALLTDSWAITAAHCVYNEHPDKLLLRMGEYDLSNEVEEPYTFQDRTVFILVTHTKFDPLTFEYDIALLRLHEPVTFQPNIVPICIPDPQDRFVGETGIVTGWGRLYDDGPLPAVLQEVHLPIIEHRECEKMYQRAGYMESIPNIFLCAGYPEGGKDSCEGDSGGPMVVVGADGRYRLAGVISWGIGCAKRNQPGVMTNVAHFTEWINTFVNY